MNCEITEISKTYFGWMMEHDYEFVGLGFAATFESMANDLIDLTNLLTGASV